MISFQPIGVNTGISMKLLYTPKSGFSAEVQPVL
jgi:hypothetical protein